MIQSWDSSTNLSECKLRLAIEVIGKKNYYYYYNYINIITLR